MLSPLAGMWPPRAGQALDGQSHEHTGQSEPGQRPPPGDGVEPEIVGEILVHPVLDVVDRLEETPRSQRDQQADDRCEHEEDAVLPAADQRVPVDRGYRHVTHARRSRRRTSLPLSVHLGAPGLAARQP